MTTPRYTERQLWERIHQLWGSGASFRSLVQSKRYVIADLDEATEHCFIRYESGSTRKIALPELYALYHELYQRGDLPRDYMRDPGNSLRLVGKRSWHAPGAAMYAMLPRLDDNIQVREGGHLWVGH